MESNMDADALLIYRIRNGDEAAIEAFVRKHYPSILSYCNYRTANHAQAEDLTQEAFYRFFRAIPTYTHKGRLLNYLYVIAGNLCRDYLRSIRQAESLELKEDIAVPQKDIEGSLDIQHAVESLSEEFREVVYMRYFLDMKLQEIADAEGISLPLVKYRLKRAKALLKDFLGKEGWS